MTKVLGIFTWLCWCKRSKKNYIFKTVGWIHNRYRLGHQWMSEIWCLMYSRSSSFMDTRLQFIKVKKNYFWSTQVLSCSKWIVNRSLTAFLGYIGSPKWSKFNHYLFNNNKLCRVNYNLKTIRYYSIAKAVYINSKRLTDFIKEKNLKPIKFLWIFTLRIYKRKGTKRD